jgi:predicted phage terminase large subunit-like protein
VRQEVRVSAYVNLIGATADDARDVMIEGESGILEICPPGERPEYLPSKRRLEWPNGAKSLIFTADEPERLRGKQHQRLWGDELAAWRYQESFDQAMFGLRLPGQSVRALFTTTPKPVRAVRDLLAADGCVITRGTTYENAANLAPEYIQQVVRRYEGTRLGRQELLGELLDDVPGALWNRPRLDELRVRTAPEMRRVVVALDPAMTSGDDADETGIIVAGKGEDGDAYILADLSGRYTPMAWARRAIDAYAEYRADRIVAEVNAGGEMVEHTLRTVDATIPYRAVHASRGKRIRAEPVAALYEQGKAHHVGSFPALEDQMCGFTPDGYDGSPDRVDALVWALTELDLHASWVVA